MTIRGAVRGAKLKFQALLLGLFGRRVDIDPPPTPLLLEEREWDTGQVVVTCAESRCTARVHPWQQYCPAHADWAHT